MRHYLSYMMILLLAAVFPLFAQESKLNPITEPSIEELRAEFQKGPNRDFSTGPLWTWNDLLTETQIRETLRDLASQKVKQVWVHPRPGLMTPYLSDDWFDMWKVSLDEAKKLDMNVWIYDENSYPSGFAGGFVPEAMPESRGMGLRFDEVSSLEKIDGNLWYVYREDGTGKYENITEEAKKSGSLPALDNGRKYLLARVHYTPQGGWFGGKWYVDLLKKGVTEKFIEITFDAYKNQPEIVGEFGKRVPGIFTDEPHPAGAYVGTWVSWNDEIPELFEKRFGYSLIDNAPSLHKPVGDWKKIRHNYHALILELFIDRWAKPCFEWCEANNLEFTGHYWEHGWPGTSHGPDNMAMYLWHQRPAIDLLMNTYNDSSPNAQFGNLRAGKELSSIVNQMGRSRTLSENYGAGGWDIRFEDLKRLGDWSYVVGVNTMNEHLSYVTIRGARKRDHPQSFSYHTPWFEGYHTLAGYFTRLSYVLSQGRQMSRAVIIEPTTTAWMYQGDAKLGEIGRSFTEFVTAMERGGESDRVKPEYDLASEDVIRRVGKVVGKNFVIGKASYEVVVLPPMMENINRATLDLLMEFVENGGTLVAVDKWPERIDGIEPPDNEEARERSRILTNRGNARVETIQGAISNVTVLSVQRRDDYFKLSTEEDSADSVFFHRRQLPDCDIVFICNTSLEKPVSGKIDVIHSRIEEWDLMSGEIRPLDIPTLGIGRLPHVHFHYGYKIPPAGSVLLVLKNKTGQQRFGVEETDKATKTLMQSDEKANDSAENVPISYRSRFIHPIFPKINDEEFVSITGTEIKIERLEPNVLTLDYVDVTVKDETRKDVYYHKVNSWVFQKNGFRNNPWDNQVQFKDELITYEFPKDSGFTLKYKFTIKDSIPDSLKLVVERPDLYAISCNGNPVSQEDGKWWLDKSFGVIDIRTVAKLGDNEIVMIASPMSMWHEIEPAYILGDFSLESAEKGYVIVPPKPLVLKPETEAKEEGHSSGLEKVSWLTSGVNFPGQKDDRAPFIVFDLGKEYDITGVKIWNYNEANLTKRGANGISVTSINKPVQEMQGRRRSGVTLAMPWMLKVPQSRGINGEQPFEHELNFKTSRYIRFDINSNHAGIKYPLDPDADMRGKDNAFVGLSEVRFLAKDADGNTFEIPNVKIDSASSELVNNTHDRKARYVVDGSGLGADPDTCGWNRQGMPFYASGVAYARNFDIGNEKSESEKYLVRLPNSGKGWYGSTAKVSVNGKTCGYVVSSPWEVDVSDAIEPGSNEITVTVIGTLKNTLGPHHVGRQRGSAWPGSFHQGPDVQPPGDAYDTIGYGLFEPFELIRR